MEDLVIEEEGASSALKITLGDFLVFINWMNQTEKSLERGEALPTTPDLDSGKVKGWIQLVQRLRNASAGVKKRKSPWKPMSSPRKHSWDSCSRICMPILHRSTITSDRRRKPKRCAVEPKRCMPARAWR